MSNSVLGRGIDALFGSDSEPDEAILSDSADKPQFPVGIEVEANGTLSLAIDLLQPNPRQPRTDFEHAALEELADSIRANGIIQPITIEDAENGTFYIIAGERRMRAAKLAGLTKVPVQLKKYSDDRKLEIALIENIQREDLNPVEEAQAYRNLMEMGKLSQEEVAKRVGKKRSTVANALRLLNLPEDMLSMLITGKITAGHGRTLLSVIDPSDQRMLFARILGSEMSVRDAEQAADELNRRGQNGEWKSDEKKVPVSRNPEFARVEQEIIDALGTKVSLKGNFERGSLQIDFFSREDLDRLYSLIVSGTKKTTESQTAKSKSGESDATFSTPL